MNGLESWMRAAGTLDWGRWAAVPVPIFLFGADLGIVRSAVVRTGVSILTQDSSFMVETSKQLMATMELGYRQRSVNGGLMPIDAVSGVV